MKDKQTVNDLPKDFRYCEEIVFERLPDGSDLPVAPVKHSFDIFERFPDGSTLWRASVTGRRETLRRVQELEKESENEFYWIDIQETDHRANEAYKINELASKSAIGEM